MRTRCVIERGKNNEKNLMGANSWNKNWFDEISEVVLTVKFSLSNLKLIKTFQ